MPTATLGRTHLVVEKNGFGALPIQRCSLEDAAKLLQKAYDNGITFFDTARAYSDSEEKMGHALSGVRQHIMIASKTGALKADGFWKDLETSLRLLQTDYLDIYQFHNPPFCPKPGDESGLYEAMQQAKQQGKIRCISITNHRLNVAQEAVDSGLYDTLQFPLSYLSTEKDLEVVEACQKANMGFLGMKALSGGLITNARAAYAFLAPFPHVLPLWGVQKEAELDEFIGFMKEPPAMNEELMQAIQADRKSLGGNFCRGCGYCMPCPAKIEISFSARMSLFLRRSPSAQWMTEEWQEKMARIEKCIHCGHCQSKCPYGLNTPQLLQENWKDYQEMLAVKTP